ncbi:lactose-binding lectin l-2-like [Branchiostoma floridae]|uniref:Lactose-binding lectin l-2-like n=1 Tax=Branchiostoma floridae TaxID=7739 RepID=A0A9J7LME9_BRAFL|nr:lactose-binding lectin l-2-like [Branchiostoma floridae]
MAAELATQHDVSAGYQEYAGRISCLQLFDFSLNEHQIAIVREACEETCPYGWYLSGYVCYRAFDELVSWHTANTRCRREGGRLATVKDADTHNFIVPLKNSVDPDEEFWIGLSDLGDIELLTLDNDAQLICN